MLWRRLRLGRGQAWSAVPCVPAGPALPRLVPEAAPPSTGGVCRTAAEAGESAVVTAAPKENTTSVRESLAILAASCGHASAERRGKSHMPRGDWQGLPPLAFGTVTVYSYSTDARMSMLYSEALDIDDQRPTVRRHERLPRARPTVFETPQAAMSSRNRSIPSTLRSSVRPNEAGAARLSRSCSWLHWFVRW